MAYDIPGQGGSVPPGQTSRANGVTTTTEKSFLSVRGESAEEVRVFWDRLAVGATIIECYGPARWAPAFGMLTDRYGITWILDVVAS